MGCASSTPMVATAGSEMLKAATHVADDVKHKAGDVVEDVTQTLGETLETAKGSVSTAVATLTNDLGTAFKEGSDALEEAKQKLKDQLEGSEGAGSTSRASTPNADSKAQTDADSLKTSTPEPEIERALANSTGNEGENAPTPKPTLAELEQLGVETTAEMANNPEAVAAAVERWREEHQIRPSTTDWEKFADQLANNKKFKPYESFAQSQNQFSVYEDYTTLRDKPNHYDGSFSDGKSLTSSQSPLSSAQLTPANQTPAPSRRNQREFAKFVGSEQPASVSRASSRQSQHAAPGRTFDFNPQRDRSGLATVLAEAETAMGSRAGSATYDGAERTGKWGKKTSSVPQAIQRRTQRVSARRLSDTLRPSPVSVPVVPEDEDEAYAQYVDRHVKHRDLGDVRRSQPRARSAVRSVPTAVKVHKPEHPVHTALPVHTTHPKHPPVVASDEELKPKISSARASPTSVKGKHDKPIIPPINTPPRVEMAEQKPQVAEEALPMPVALPAPAAKPKSPDLTTPLKEKVEVSGARTDEKPPGELHVMPSPSGSSMRSIRDDMKATPISTPAKAEVAGKLPSRHASAASISRGRDKMHATPLDTTRPIPDDYFGEELPPPGTRRTSASSVRSQRHRVNATPVKEVTPVFEEAVNELPRKRTSASSIRSRGDRVNATPLRMAHPAAEELLTPVSVRAMQRKRDRVSVTPLKAVPSDEELPAEPSTRRTSATSVRKARHRANATPLKTPLKMHSPSDEEIPAELPPRRTSAASVRRARHRANATPLTTPLKMYSPDEDVVIFSDSDAQTVMPAEQPTRSQSLASLSSSHSSEVVIRSTYNTPSTMSISPDLVQIIKYEDCELEAALARIEGMHGSTLNFIRGLTDLTTKNHSHSPSPSLSLLDSSRASPWSMRTDYSDRKKKPAFIAELTPQGRKRPSAVSALKKVSERCEICSTDYVIK